jgi:hypothetical protein
MNHEECYAKGFQFDKMVPGRLDSEMVEDTAKIMNEASRISFRSVSLSTTSLSEPPPIAEKITKRLYSEKQQRLSVCDLVLPQKMS